MFELILHQEAHAYVSPGQIRSGAVSAMGFYKKQSNLDLKLQERL
jgi:hypothetical protein